MPVGRKCRNFPMVRHMHTCHSSLPDSARTRTWNFIEIRTIHLCTTLGLVFQFQKCVGMGANETFYKLVHSNCRRYQCMSQKLIFWKKNFYSENTYLLEKIKNNEKLSLIHPYYCCFLNILIYTVVYMHKIFHLTPFLPTFKNIDKP